MPDVIMDAELVVVDERGHPQFDRLRSRAFMSRKVSIGAAMAQHPAALFVFDLLWCEGEDWCKQPLLARKAMLEEVLRGSNRVCHAGHDEVHGQRLFREAEKMSRGN